MDPDLQSLLEPAGRFLRTRYRLSAQEQEELEQEIALAVARTIRKGAIVKEREAYARAIARNVAVGYFRRKRGVVSLEELEPASTGSSLDELIGRENDRAILRAMLGLSDDYRRVVLAVYLEGLSVDQVARLEGIKPKTVYARLARAEEQLRGLLRWRFSTLFRRWERSGKDARAIARALLPPDEVTDARIREIDERLRRGS